MLHGQDGTLLEWSNRQVCKTSVHGFESHRCLHYTLAQTTERQSSVLSSKEVPAKGFFLFIIEKIQTISMMQETGILI